MANTDRARKLLVRTALVTSATIATIVGGCTHGWAIAAQRTLKLPFYLEFVSYSLSTKTGQVQMTHD